MRSTKSSGRNFSLTSTDCTPEFSRSRSFALRSSEVITMTGMSRQSCVLLQGGDDLKAVHLRHHKVEQDHVGLFLSQKI